MTNRPLINRRGLVALGVAAATFVAVSAKAQTRQTVRTLPAQRRWTPEPTQAPAKEGFADSGGTKLFYWDTGGTGEPVILLHASTGSASVWGYQQPALVKAGYRVIGYSRRSHYRSDVGDPKNPGTAMDDLHVLIQSLKLDRVHLVGTALGGFTPTDYALSYPDKVISMTIANSLGGVQEPAYTAKQRAILPKGWDTLPSEFKELSAAYRASNPEGCKRWLELEQIAHTNPQIRQVARNALTWANLETIKVPALILTGDADLYQPPPLMQEYAGHFQNADVYVLTECGHSAYWEQPEAFNATLLDFLRKHRA